MKQEQATTGVDSISKVLRRNLSLRKIGVLCKRAGHTLLTRGWQALGRELLFRWRLATHGEVWFYRTDKPLRRELRMQAKLKLGSMPVITVVVPLYNTPLPYLQQMVQSVQKQSYSKWQLVLADASDASHAYVGAFCQKQAAKDSRMVYLPLDGNNGIAANTNAGLAAATGGYIALLDHDDVLTPNALFEIAQAINNSAADLIYSDEVVLSGDLKRLCEYHFKPDYAPDTLRGCNYITHLCAFSRKLLEAAGGGESSRYNGAQDYDLILRLSEHAVEIHHIPKVLYYWRSHAGSTASGIEQKQYAVQAGAKAIDAHLQRLHLQGEAQPLALHAGAYRVQYQVVGTPMVSVVIPSMDHTDDLKRCLDSVYKLAGWPNFEVLVVENNSQNSETESFYTQAQQSYANLQVLRYSGGFNFSAICNLGAKNAKGQHLLLLNNDTQLISKNFLQEMLSYSQRPDVGAVGAMLYYPDDTVQHAGLIIGIGSTAGVSHKGHQRGNGGDMFRLCTTQNVSAVTGACLMVKTALYQGLHGMDEQNFAVAFNDVDFCLRLREQGFWNVFTPFAQAYHYESKSRGLDTQGTKLARFRSEAANLQKRHYQIMQQGDPFYNPHFTLKYENFGYR